MYRYLRIISLIYLLLQDVAIEKGTILIYLSFKRLARDSTLSHIFIDIYQTQKISRLYTVPEFCASSRKQKSRNCILTIIFDSGLNKFITSQRKFILKHIQGSPFSAILQFLASYRTTKHMIFLLYMWTYTVLYITRRNEWQTRIILFLLLENEHRHTHIHT